MIRLPWSARLGLANCVILLSLLSTTVAYGETPNGPGVKYWEYISLRSNVLEYDLVCNLAGIWCNINYTLFSKSTGGNMDPPAEDFCVHHSFADFRIHFKNFKNNFMKVKGNLHTKCELERESQQIFLRWKKPSRHIFLRWKTFLTHFCMVKNFLHTFFRVKIILTHFFKVKTFLTHLTLLPHILWGWKIIWTHF